MMFVTAGSQHYVRIGKQATPDLFLFPLVLILTAASFNYYGSDFMYTHDHKYCHVRWHKNVSKNMFFVLASRDFPSFTVNGFYFVRRIPLSFVEEKTKLHLLLLYILFTDVLY